MNDEDKNISPTNNQDHLAQPVAEIQPPVNEEKHPQGDIIFTSDNTQLYPADKKPRNYKRIALMSLIGLTLILSTAIFREPVLKKVFNDNVKDSSNFQPEAKKIYDNQKDAQLKSDQMISSYKNCSFKEYSEAIELTPEEINEAINSLNDFQRSIFSSSFPTESKFNEQCIKYKDSEMELLNIRREGQVKNIIDPIRYIFYYHPKSTEDVLEVTVDLYSMPDRKTKWTVGNPTILTMQQYKSSDFLILIPANRKIHPDYKIAVEIANKMIRSYDTCDFILHQEARGKTDQEAKEEFSKIDPEDIEYRIHPYNYPTEEFFKKECSKDYNYEYLDFVEFQADDDGNKPPFHYDIFYRIGENRVIYVNISQEDNLWVASGTLEEDSLVFYANSKFISTHKQN